MNYQNNLLIAVEACLQAGEAILKVYERDFNIDFKEDKSPLTEADTISNQIINEFLLKTDLPIVSEENKQISFSERKNWDYCWIVDPVDGTKEFIKKNGEFTINIALTHNGLTKLGVIYVPVTRELYYTNSDKTSSFKSIVPESINNVENLLFRKEDEIYPREEGSTLIRVVGSRSHMNNDTVEFVEKLKKQFDNVEVVSKGSSLKFCLVAEGKADFYPRFAPTMEWDTAAGQAICEAVGLRVIDQETNDVMIYNRENQLNNYFLVTK